MGAGGEERNMYGLQFSIMVSDYYVAILAGGKSERFGMNKALFNFNGESLLSRAIRKTVQLSIIPKQLLNSFNDEPQYRAISEHLGNELNMHISGNSCTKESYGEFAMSSTRKVRLQFIFDTNKNKDHVRAAIFGFESVCKHIGQGYFLSVPCDTPLFPTSIMNEFISIVESDHDLDAIIPKWNTGFIEPLHGLYRVESVRPIIDDNIERGIYKLSELLQQDLNIRYFNIDDHLQSSEIGVEAFYNINTKNDLCLLK